jgi:hypothetical protein
MQAVVDANFTGIIGDSNTVADVDAPATSVRGSGNSIITSAAGTYIRVNADAVYVAGATASGSITGSTPNGVLEAQFGGDLTAEPSLVPVRRRRLQALARFAEYSTKALTTVDLVRRHRYRGVPAARFPRHGCLTARQARVLTCASRPPTAVGQPADVVVRLGRPAGPEQRRHGVRRPSGAVPHQRVGRADGDGPLADAQLLHQPRFRPDLQRPGRD